MIEEHKTKKKEIDKILKLPSLKELHIVGLDISNEELSLLHAKKDLKVITQLDEKSDESIGVLMHSTYLVFKSKPDGQRFINSMPEMLQHLAVLRER